jgi:hypothetical protein
MKKFMNSGKELKEERKILINIMFNGGGSSLFPQTFIQNLNGVMQWETHWAILKSPPIVEYFAKYDLSSMPDISPDFKNLILSNREELADYRSSPSKKWEFTSTHNENMSGSYTGTLIILTNRSVHSAGEAFVGASQSIKNRIVIGENTGGVAQFSSACGYYLPNSRFIANLPRHFILIPGLEECIGYLPDYWLNTTEPVKEVMDWLNDPDNYRFSYSNSYHDMLKKLDISAVLPKEANVIPPDPEVPETLAKFSGKWYGVSNGVLDHLLVVEKINHSLEVDAIYAWGVASQWGLRPGWQRFKGRFENHKLILTDEKSRVKITYKFSSDDYIDAMYERPGVYDRIELTKLDK